MTAQGEDLLAWLDRAITAREQSAQTSIEQAAVHLAGADPSSVSVWRVIERPATGTFVATCDQWGRVAEVVPTYGGAHAEHIALNDPASVLRRCAADRKLLELHRPVGGVCTVCAAEEAPSEDSEGEFEWSRDALPAPCATLLTLAEGYGWTEGER